MDDEGVKQGFLTYPILRWQAAQISVHVPVVAYCLVWVYLIKTMMNSLNRVKFNPIDSKIM